VGAAKGQGIGRSTAAARETRRWGTTREATGGETREARGCAGADASSRTSQRGGGHATSDRLGHTRTGLESGSDASRGALAQASAGIGGRRRLDGERNDVGAADNGQAKGTLLFGLDSLAAGAGTGRGRFVLLALDASELFGIGEDEVHVLVKSKHLAGHGTPIVEGDTHAPVDITDHLSLLVRRHLGGSFGSSQLGLVLRKAGAAREVVTAT
jgi:hypothetical protein